MNKLFGLVLLAACIAAAIVFKRFVFVAWYPVFMSFLMASTFALSLLKGPKSTLCYTVALPVYGGTLPDYADRYFWRLTVFWVLLLSFNGCIAIATVFAPRWVWVLWNCCLSYCMTASSAGIECLIRKKVFKVTFHTSGSTSEPKEIVKSFSKLISEVRFHKRRLKSSLKAKPLFISTVDPSHMFGMLWRKMLSQASGCRCTEGVVLSPEELVDNMRKASSVFLVTTPSFLSHFLSYADQYDVPRNCVEVVTSGSPLSRELAEKAECVFGVAPREIFGSTETGGVAERRWKESDEWKVFSRVKVCVDDDGLLVVESPFSYVPRYVLGDKVTLSADGRSFKLLGRADRLVKIAEERVSLPEMESKMNALDEIDDCTLCALDGEKGKYLGAVIVPAQAASGERSPLFWRKKLDDVFPKGAIPRKFRFVAEIPRNAQGKIVQSEVVRLFDDGVPQLPIVENVETGDGSWRADIVFRGSESYFQGHFEGFPVLAGVVQLGIAKAFADTAFGMKSSLNLVKKLKFAHVIVPGDRVSLLLEKTGVGDVSFTYRKGEFLCSSAVLCYS